jgi:hypothetical protein
MPKHRRSRGDNPPPSGKRPSLSKMGEWERMWVRRLGLEDIDWDPEKYCVHCIAEREAREAAAEELAPPSGPRLPVSQSLLWAQNPRPAGGPKARSKRRPKLMLVPSVHRKGEDP